MSLRNKRKIKVLHIGEYVKGGVATYLKTILGIDNELIDEYLVLSNEKSIHEWDLPNDKIHYYEYQRGLSGVVFAIKTIIKLVNTINPDIIYCHSTWAGVIGRVPFLWKRTNAKIIYNAHGWAFLMDVSNLKRKIYSFIERLLLLVTDCVVNVSKYEYTAAVNYGLDAKKMMVLYSGTDYPKEFEKERNVYSDDEETVKILFVGRFDPQKGVDYLLNCFQRYSFDNVHLYLIGGSVVSAYEYEKNNTSKITFLGWVPNEKIDEYYSSCDVVIMPSRWEAFGLVAIEAMKYSKPIIASNRGALPELIHDNYNGYIFDLDNEESLKNILEGLSKKKLKLLGENAYKEYTLYYTADIMRERVKKLYFNVLDMT